MRENPDSIDIPYTEDAVADAVHLAQQRTAFHIQSAEQKPPSEKGQDADDVPSKSQPSIDIQGQSVSGAIGISPKAQVTTDIRGYPVSEAAIYHRKANPQSIFKDN